MLSISRAFIDATIAHKVHTLWRKKRKDCSYEFKLFRLFLSLGRLLQFEFKKFASSFSSILIRNKKEEKKEWRTIHTAALIKGNDSSREGACTQFARRTNLSLWNEEGRSRFVFINYSRLAMEAAFEAVTTACIISVEMHQSASRSAIELIRKQDQAVSCQRSTFLLRIFKRSRCITRIKIIFC